MAIDVSREKLLGVKEVAEQLEVCQHTVRAWMHAGLLEAVRVGRRWKTTANALNAFVQANTAASREPPPPTEEELRERAEAARKRIEMKYGFK